MKNNITIKGRKVSELLMWLYITAVLVGLPLFVTNAYYNINVDKYYYYCGACVLLIPILILKALERPSVKGFFKNLSAAEIALLIFWVIAGLSFNCQRCFPTLCLSLFGEMKGGLAGCSL